jgi:hypothetical protein
MTFSHKLRILFAFLTLWGIGYALPGVQVSPEMVLAVEDRLREGQDQRLVLVQNAAIDGVNAYRSQAGKTHYRFLLSSEGSSYSAIMFEGDWTEEEVAILRSGRADLIGFWETFQGAPSFTTKLVFASAGEAPSEQPDRTREYVRVEAESIGGVEPFVSKAQKMHVRFTFSVSGYPGPFEGVVYEGDWDNDLLSTLRSGRATMIGYWDEYQDEPYFVLTRVER